MKFVISDKEKSYQKEVTPKEAEALLGMKIGQRISGGIIGFEGYEFLITGGSDLSGFPMRKGLHVTTAVSLLLKAGVGYNPKKKGMRDRKRVRGERITDDIAQVNVKVLKAGAKPLSEYFSK